MRSSTIMVSNQAQSFAETLNSDSLLFSVTLFSTYFSASLKCNTF